MTAPQLITLLPGEFASHVAEWVLNTAVAAKGSVAIALSGGSTPAPVYRKFAETDFAARFPWRRTHWFWGDERFVPHDDPRSNFKLACDCFLSSAPAPRENIHPVPVDHPTPEQSAAAYEGELQKFYGANTLSPSKPLLWINLLGIGDNGHFASLFPGSAALNERTRWTATAMDGNESRITLTYPALESSRHAAFMLSGAGKADILPRFLSGDPTIPSGRFRPSGDCLVFADTAAAAKVLTTTGASRGTIQN